MKRFFSFLLAVISFVTIASAQENQKTGIFGGNQFAIKVEPFHGVYTSHSYHFEKFKTKVYSFRREGSELLEVIGVTGVCAMERLYLDGKLIAAHEASSLTILCHDQRGSQKHHRKE